MQPNFTHVEPNLHILGLDDGGLVFAEFVKLERHDLTGEKPGLMGEKPFLERKKDMLRLRCWDLLIL